MYSCIFYEWHKTVDWLDGLGKCLGKFMDKVFIYDLFEQN